MSRSVISGTLFALLTVAACELGPAWDESSVDDRSSAFSQGPLLKRGHEDITRFAIERANPMIQTATGQAGFFPTIPEGDDCDVTGNTVMKGGCATDYPDDRMLLKYASTADAWDLSPTLQDLHFLRNHVGAGDVERARTTCLGSRARILAATEWAVAAWKANDVAQAHYWIGHATHVVQDSFSEAHTSRSGTLHRTFDDVCSYGREVAGVCFHESIDLRDRVWRETLLCYLDPNNRSWDCLTDVAQAAALATAGYLRLVGTYLVQGSTGNLAALLDTYFDGGATDDYVDYFHCETLPGLPDGTACTTADICQSGFCVDGFCCNNACAGLCEQCNGNGTGGTCTPAATNTDPRGQCKAATDGDVACNGACNGGRACVWPNVTTRCGVCAACDGAGHCSNGMPDDAECGTIECSALDTACRVHDDLTASRCAGVGACKAPNVVASCTSYTDICAADGGVTADGGGEPTGDGGTGGAADGGCGVAGAPGAGLLPLAAALLVLGRARRSRPGASRQTR